MGKLIARDNLVPDPTWFFPDAHYSWESRRWVYKWPSEYFPHMLAIHCDDIRSDPRRKTEIRKWIESNIDGTVIFELIEKNYRVYYNEDRDWNYSFERTNHWIAFYFEDEGSALLFKLKFLGYIKDITNLHPTTGDEYEKTSYYKTY